MKDQSKREERNARVIGIRLDENRIRILAPLLKRSLEQMRILEKIDLEKELEPTTYTFLIGRRASRH